MPYTSEKIKLPRTLDRRVKLTEEDKENITTRYNNGEGIRAIARAYESLCSRRMIQFVLFPERLQKMTTKHIQEKSHLKYYDREKNTVSVRNTRNYKQGLYIKKKIK